MARFDYPIAVVPTDKITPDDNQVYALLAPDHYRWLCDHNISFQASCYRWPEMLALWFHHLPLGTSICQMQVTVDADFAGQFAQFTGLSI